MAHLHSIPIWFLGFNIAFETIFMLAAALVALYSYKIYKLSLQRETKLFAISFAFLSASYFISSIISLFFVSIFEGNTFAITLNRIYDLRNFSVALYISFFILGYVTLLYTTLKIKRLRIYAILIILTFAAINFSFNKSFMIFFISSLFLLFINYHYYMEFMKRRNTNVLLVFWGMFFLLLSNLLFLLKTTIISTYVFSHISNLLGYVFIMSSLVRVMQNGKKKKQIGDNKGHT